MSRNADQPTAPAPRTLIDLVRQVADADGRAFARLYHALAPAVAGNLRPTLPDPADAAAVVSATFVEVWLLARFHAAAGTDVPTWVAAIATRRAGERSLGRLQAMQDKQYALALARLLDPPSVRPVGWSVR